MEEQKEFSNIIKSLIKHSYSVNEKSFQIVEILNTMENERISTKEKEQLLGLNKESEPLGVKTKDEVLSKVMVYKPLSSKTTMLKKFIFDLESYEEIKDIEDKKQILICLQKQISILRENSYYPESVVITKQRYVVWNILESNYQKTLKRLTIESIFNRIKLLHVKYKEQIEYIYNYYQKQQEIFQELASLNNAGLSDEIIKTKRNILHSKLNIQIEPTIAPLLNETKKVVNSFELKLEELIHDNELTNTQKDILKSVLPAISEYYIDQTYALSGGYSYTDVADKLKTIQQLVNQEKPMDEILLHVDKLDYSMQHLYVLHWIAETLLKDILKCFQFSCSMGRTIRIYKSKYQTKTVFEVIKKAVNIRNDIAHNALIWEPSRLKFAISEYRKYIEVVSYEQNINLSKYRIHKKNRKCTEEHEEQETQTYFNKYFNVKPEELKQMNEKYYNKLINELKKTFWNLSEKKMREYKKEISYERHIYNKKEEEKRKDEFAKKVFNKSYKEVENILVKNYEKNYGYFSPHEKNKRDTAKVNKLYGLYKNQDNIAEKTVREIKMVLESMQSE